MSRFRRGWEAGKAAAAGITETVTAEDGTVDREFLEGFAAGMDNTINGERYAQMEMARIERDLTQIAAEEESGPPPAPTPNDPKPGREIGW